MSASIIFNQPSASAGVAGKARDDLAVALLVTCTNATVESTYNWVLIEVPIRSALVRGTAGAAASFTFTPDVKGTYLVSLQVNGSATPIENSTSFIAVRTSGANTLGWRYPAAEEQAEDNIVRAGLGFTADINVRGWATDQDLQTEAVEAGIAQVQAATDVFLTGTSDNLVKLDGATGLIDATLLPTASGITDLTGDVTATGSGSVAATIAAMAVTNAKLADVSTATFKGRTTAGTGSPEDLTVTQATALLDAFVGDSGAGGTKGSVPAPGAGDAAAGKFMKADGAWQVQYDQVLLHDDIATGTYTFANTDAGKKKRFSVAVTATVPPTSTGSWVTGTVIYGRQTGAGQVTIAAGAGVTINQADFLTAAQYSEFSLHYLGSDVWDLSGDLTT